MGVSPGCRFDEPQVPDPKPPPPCSLFLYTLTHKPKNTNPASPTSLLPPTHTNKKIQNLLVLLLLFAIFLTPPVSTKPRCLSVRRSVLFCLSLLLPLNLKFESKKKPRIFNLNRPNLKLNPTLCYSNSSTSRYPRTKFSKEKKTHPYVRHPLTIS